MIEADVSVGANQELGKQLAGHPVCPGDELGLATCENFLPTIEGPLVKRPGFYRVNAAAATASWLNAFREFLPVPGAWQPMPRPLRPPLTAMRATWSAAPGLVLSMNGGGLRPLSPERGEVSLLP